MSINWFTAPTMMRMEDGKKQGEENKGEGRG
jgi:hypothetical protein